MELLREFAKFNSTGMRGVIRMKRLQAEATALIERIDRKKKDAKE